jgi:hypothetical protein
LPRNQPIAGVWVGERYYLFQATGGLPSLRTVGLEDAKLGPAVPLAPASTMLPDRDKAVPIQTPTNKTMAVDICQSVGGLLIREF